MGILINVSSRGVLPTVARRCVWSRNLENEEAEARYRAVKIQPRWVVTPRKQQQRRQQQQQQQQINVATLIQYSDTSANEWPC